MAASLVGAVVTNAANSAYNVTVPAGANRIAIVVFGLKINSGGTNPSSVAATIGGVSLSACTPVTEWSSGNNVGSALYPFYLLEASFPANGTRSVAITVTGGTNLQGYVSTSLFLQNATQGAPTVTSNTGETTTLRVPTGSGTFNVNAGGIAVAGIADAYPCTHTESAGWTEESDLTGAAGNGAHATALQAYAAGGTSYITWTLSGAWSNCGVTLYWDQVAAGAGVVPFNRGTMSGGMQQLSGGMRAHHRSAQIVVPELPSGWRRGRSGLCVRA